MMPSTTAQNTKKKPGKGVTLDINGHLKVVERNLNAPRNGYKLEELSAGFT